MCLFWGNPPTESRMNTTEKRILLFAALPHSCVAALMSNSRSVLTHSRVIEPQKCCAYSLPLSCYVSKTKA